MGGRGAFTIAHVVNQMPTACAPSAAGQGSLWRARFRCSWAGGYGLTIIPLDGPVLQRKMMADSHRDRAALVAEALFLVFLWEYAKERSPNSLIHTTLAETAG